VEALADRKTGARPDRAPEYSSMIPLAEIIAETLGCGVNTKKVSVLYDALLAELGPEFTVLRTASPDDVSRAGSQAVSEALNLMRAGEVEITPGFDGEYGKIRLFGDRQTRGAEPSVGVTRR
jgi:PHP family Zn ribbon phosphoesterase